jgi:putative glutamine amidotransferase
VYNSLHKKEEYIMKKAMIALTGRNQSVAADNASCSDNRSYFDYVRTADGIPAVVNALNEKEAAMIAEHFDGLLITGGDDVNPALYKENNAGSITGDPVDEKSDILLYKAFRNAEKPILGICRGIQIIAVIEGGTLIQDIPSVFHTQHNQHLLSEPIPTGSACHNDRFIEGTELYNIFGSMYPVNSYHHQAVKDLPVGFKAAAYSPEGFIEGIEKDNVIAVQWHPERMLHDARQRRIVEVFINKCILLG